MSAKSGPSMLVGEYVLLRFGLAIATAMEVNKKATTDLSTVLSARTMTKKTLVTTKTLREGSAIRPANAAFDVSRPEKYRTMYFWRT
jgi:hypothetical protein